MNSMTHFSSTHGLYGSHQEPRTGIVSGWIANFRRWRQKQIDEAELRGLDARTLADLGIEFAPEMGHSIIHSKAEAMAVAVTAMVNSGSQSR